MFQTQDGAKAAILGKAYPELLYGSDPDIERYFELRSQGRSVEALGLYNSRLKAKYPDEGRRVLLLSHFRNKDPRYRSLLRQSALDLASSLIERVKRNIRYLTLPMEGVPERDAYRLLKAVEQVARFLPADRFEAVAALDNYRRYAELLDFKRELMAFTAELGKEYLLESQAEGDGDNVDFIERSRQLEKRERENRSAKRHFDLSRIRFDAAELARIVLPPHITRKEDKVIGYCLKYWGLVADPGFERAVLLYSRKYRTFHYDVYRTIKTGRARKLTDDEILNRVSTALSSSYSYSVQGDIYMLSMWRRLKAGILAAPSEARIAVPEPIALPAPGKAPPSRKASSGRKKESPRIEAPAPKKSEKPVRTETASAPSTIPAPSRSAPSSRVAAPLSVQKIAKAKKPAKPQKENAKASTGSVSEIIRRVTGRSYDVYHDIFLVKVRSSIRAALTASQSRSHGLFDESLNAAEEAVHGFMRRNYDNHFMDWEGSKQRGEIQALGYALPSLVPLIEDCAKKL